MPRNRRASYAGLSTRQKPSSSWNACSSFSSSSTSSSLVCKATTRSSVLNSAGSASASVLARFAGGGACFSVSSHDVSRSRRERSIPSRTDSSPAPSSGARSRSVRSWAMSGALGCSCASTTSSLSRRARARAKIGGRPHHQVALRRPAHQDLDGPRARVLALPARVRREQPQVGRVLLGQEERLVARAQHGARLRPADDHDPGPGPLR